MFRVLRNVTCSRRSDRGDSAKRYVSRKKKQRRGGGVWVFSSLFFSRCLPSRRTPLSERLEQAIRNATTQTF